VFGADGRCQLGGWGIAEFCSIHICRSFATQVASSKTCCMTSVGLASLA
jgi:hypothetical protein